MELTQINLIVTDLERSRGFYAALGCEMRPITVPGQEGAQAWEVISGCAPITLHSEGFAAWWDRSAPRAQPGSTTIDLTFGSRDEAAAFVESVRKGGGRVIQEAEDMPWGQAYAIFCDPDGHRWGVKAPTTD